MARPPIVVSYRANGGSLHGTVERCAYGGVVLVQQDSAMRFPGFTYDGRCDARSTADLKLLVEPEQ